MVEDEPSADEAAVEEACQRTKDGWVLGVDHVRLPSGEQDHRPKEEREVADWREIAWTVEKRDAFALSAHHLGDLISAKPERDPTGGRVFSLTHPRG